MKEVLFYFEQKKSGKMKSFWALEVSFGSHIVLKMLHRPVVNLIKHFMIVIYDARVVHT